MPTNMDSAMMPTQPNGYQPIDDEASKAPPHPPHPPHPDQRPEDDDKGTTTPRCVVLPEEGSWKLNWDMWVLLLVVYSAIIVPFRISFSADATGAVWAFELCLSLCFIVDLTLSFFTAVWMDGEWVADQRKIAAVYMRGWFWVDAPSSLPLELLDLLPGDMSQFGFLRFLRMFRLLRLLKLLKIDQIIEQIEEQLEMSLRFLRLVIMLIKVVFVGHFLGCMWYSVAVYARANGAEETWLDRYASANGVDEPTIGQYYSWSLYWALTTLTTVGCTFICPRT